jgi:hypothetical protein
VRWKYWRNRCARYFSHSTRQCLPPPLFVTQKGCRSQFQNPPIKISLQKKSKCQPNSQILIFILTYCTDSLPIITYEISGKKHQLDFELKAISHFHFENHFYLRLTTCAVVNLDDNWNCQFYGKAANKWLQNGRLLVNDPFVGKLYHFATRLVCVYIT